MNVLSGPQAKKLKNEPANGAKGAPGAKKNGVKGDEDEEDDDDDDEVRTSCPVPWPILTV